jgi:hypothetical protein
MPPTASNQGFGKGFQSLLGMGGAGPDASGDAINALLQQFGGINVPAPQQTGLFENTGWGGRHPALSGGLDNALIALGNMGPTGPTAGDNISNVARGLQSIGPTRQMQRLAPVMAALQMAQGVAGLQQSAANINREGAMAQYYGGRNAATEYAANQRLAGVQSRATLSAAQAQHGPQIGIDPATNKPSVMYPTIDDDGNLKMVPHPEIDVNEFKKSQQKQKVASILGGSFEGLVTQGMLGDDPDSYVKKNTKGKVIAQGPQAYWNDANNILLQHRTASAGVSSTGASNRQDTGNWHSDQSKLFTGLVGKEPGKDQIENEAILESQKSGFKVTPQEAEAKVRSNREQVKGQLQKHWGDFSLLDEDEQRRQGGIMGYLQKQGYDPTTNKFGPVARTGAPQAAAPNVMGGGAKATAPSPKGLDPAVQAIIDSLNGPR